MELKRLEIEGFKKFSGKRTFAFKKGINVIHGDNEKGKSTILEAIVAAIGGLSPKEIEEVKNWQTDRCRVSLTYTTDQGETFKIERDFLEDSSVLSKKEKKKFERIASQQRRVNHLLKEHFGIVDKKLLRSTIFVRSKEMQKVGDDSDLIKKNLSTLIAGATVNPVSTAVEKLKTERKALKHYKGKGGEIYNLRSQFEEAEKTLAQARKDEEEVKTAERELKKKKKELENKKKRVVALQSLLEKYDRKVELETDERSIREQLKTLRAMPKVGEKDPTLLYMGFVIIIVSVILATLYSLWAIFAASIGFVFIYLYFKREVKLQIPKELQDQSERLAQDLAAVQSESRQYAGIKLDSEEVERKRERYKELKETVDRLKIDVPKLESKIDTIKSRSYDVAAALADKENLKRKIEEQEEMIEAYDLATDILKESERKAYESISPDLSKKASETISKITDKKYSNLKITSDLEIKVKVPEAGEFREIEFPLSDGTQDQLYLAARLAISEVLSGGRKLPLLLDESLAFFDYNRFRNCMNLIKNLSKKYSVFISSLDNKYDKFADNIITL